jgi:hypothetical protein
MQYGIVRASIKVIRIYFYLVFGPDAMLDFTPISSL